MNFVCQKLFGVTQVCELLTAALSQNATIFKESHFLNVCHHVEGSLKISTWDKTCVDVSAHLIIVTI